MPHNRLLLFFFISAVAMSCQEEDGSPISYPSLYYKSGVETVGTLRVFTSQGEIATKSIINKYSEYDTSYFSYFVRSHFGFLDTVEFITSGVVKLNHQFQERNCQVDTELNLFILTEDQVTKACCSYGEVFTRSFQYSIGRVKPEVHSEFLQSSVRGFYAFGYTERKKFVLRKSGGKIVAPVIQYIVYSTHARNVGLHNNFLKPNFYEDLAAGDTLTLMESQVVFKKQ